MHAWSGQLDLLLAATGAGCRGKVASNVQIPQTNHYFMPFILKVREFKSLRTSHFENIPYLNTGC